MDIALSQLCSQLIQEQNCFISFPMRIACVKLYQKALSSFPLPACTTPVNNWAERKYKTMTVLLALLSQPFHLKLFLTCAPCYIDAGMSFHCLIQVGNGIELEAVGLQFESSLWRPCGVTWDSSRTVVVIKLRRTSALQSL